MERAELFIDCRCHLGEGPLWHPGRNELFWFDIDRYQLFRANTEGSVLGRWTFDDAVSVAGIVDDGTLLVGGAEGLFLFHIDSGSVSPHRTLEADKPGNRSNDGRVHPAGTFWVGTMSRKGDQEPGSGAVYGYREGKVSTILDAISISNSICFSPDGRTAYFTDTPTGQILRCAVSADTGLPEDEWSVFADTRALPGAPDGSVVDSAGFLWNARYGGSAVIRFAPDGSVDRTVEVPAPNVTCPAFGEADLKTLYITTAGGHLQAGMEGYAAQGGSVFRVDAGIAGQAEPRVRL